MMLETRLTGEYADASPLTQGSEPSVVGLRRKITNLTTNSKRNSDLNGEKQTKHSHWPSAPRPNHEARLLRSKGNLSRPESAECVPVSV